MQGYVAVLVEPGSTEPVAYWDGSTMQDEVSNSFIFASRQIAKSSTANIQSIYDDHDILLVPASRTVTIGGVGATIS